MDVGVVCWCVCSETTECWTASSGEQRFHCSNYRPQRSNGLLGREIWTGSVTAKRSEGPFSQRVKCGGVALCRPIDDVHAWRSTTRECACKPGTEGTVGPGADWLSREQIKRFLLDNYSGKITVKFSQFLGCKWKSAWVDNGMCKAQFPVIKWSSKITLVKWSETISFVENRVRL